MRGPMANQTDGEIGDNIAIEMWNDLNPQEKIWEIARKVRIAQKEFYRLRKKVGKTQHDELLQDALAKESLLDKILRDHFDPDQENKQERLL